MNDSSRSDLGFRQVKACKCGHLAGWYERVVYSATLILTPEGMSDACEYTHCRGGKRKYCLECKRDITHLIQPKEEVE